MDNKQTTNGARNSRRWRMILTILLVFAVAGGAWAIWWYTAGRYEESTDDAYVAGNLVQVTPQASGTIIAIHADDTQVVQAGQLLVEFDDSDARVNLARAEADLGKAVRAVRGLNAAVAQDAALVAERRTVLDRARQDLARRNQLLATQAISGEEVAHARDAVAQAQNALDVAEQQLAGAKTAVVHGDIRKHPDVAAAIAQVKSAFLELARCHIVAPVTGQVARRTAQLGQKVAVGTPLMNIVPLQDVWVEANLKENQLASVLPGQKADVTADVYGDSVHYTGIVEGLGAGTGSVFSLLPPQNASGNWIKVVQRVPVRIRLDPAQIKAHPLRPGLSMKVTIDTRSKPAPEKAAQVYVTPVYGHGLQDADQVIERIIRDNMK